MEIMNNNALSFHILRSHVQQGIFKWCRMLISCVQFAHPYGPQPDGAA